MSKEKKVKGKVFDLTLVRFVFGLISKHKWILIISVILTVITSALATSIPYIVKTGLNVYIIPDNSGSSKNIILYALNNFGVHTRGGGLLFCCEIFLGLLFIQTLFSYFQTYYTEWLGQQAIYQLRRRIFNHI